MKSLSKLLILYLAGLMSAAMLIPAPTAYAAPPLNLGSPKTVSASDDAMHANGDGRFVSWKTSNKGYEFTLYDADLNVIKEFAINVMVSVGTPTAVSVVRGADQIETFYLTDKIFNDDNLFEVLFTSGDLYNERGQFLGVMNGNYVYAPGESDEIYVGGSSIIEDVEESQIWIDKYRNSIPTWMKEILSLYDGILHNDFGAPSMGMMADAAGTDVVGDTGDYNWFMSHQDYEVHNNTAAYVNLSPYLFYYLTIDRCNTLIAGLKGNEASAAKATVLADAYALRGWAYMALAQRYQFTYYGNESKPCVPLIDEYNSVDLETKGVPRSSVKQTYDFIMADLDKAIALLEANATEQAKVLPDAPKMMINKAAAYGLRARANLIMHRYAQAEADARKAITVFEGRPYMIGEIHPGGFTDLDDASWMWGLRYYEDSRALISFTSFMSPFVMNSYSMNTTRNINAALFNSIPLTDTRRKLFLDSNGECEGLTEGQWNHLGWYNLAQPYRGVKFGAQRGTVEPELFAIADVPLMRVEEMYYIVAEAMAMAGDTSGARSYLLAFVNEHRDPSFTVASDITPTALRDVIWNQRRIEFWGEGLSFYDLMRLNKGVNRIGGLYPVLHNYKIAADDPILLLRFPDMEKINKLKNVALTESNNNPEAEKPTVYDENGDVIPFAARIYSYDSEYNLTESNSITYTTEPSMLHNGWKQFSTMLPGYGNVEIHFDPASGKVEIPRQNPDASDPELYVADAYTFYKSEDYAGSSYVTENEFVLDNHPIGYDFCLDLVSYRIDPSGNPTDTSRAMIWLGGSLPGQGMNITLPDEDTADISDIIFTDSETGTFNLTYYYKEGYNRQYDILTTPFESNKDLVNYLKSRPVISGPGDETVTKTLPIGTYYICTLTTDNHGHVISFSTRELKIAAFPFKEKAEDYGEWGEWIDSQCEYQFINGLIMGGGTVDMKLRRNVANPDLVNLHLPFTEINLFNGVPRDFYVDLATGYVSCPYADTGISEVDYKSIYVSDYYYANVQDKYNLPVFNEDFTNVYLSLWYKLVRPNGEIQDTPAEETLELPASLLDILSGKYQPEAAPERAPAAKSGIDIRVKK